MSRPKIILITVIVVVLIGIGLAVYFTWPSEEVVETGKPGILPTAQPKIATPQEAGAGNVGEVIVEDEESGKELPRIEPTMPPVIFNTSGSIVEVKKDGLIVAGDGQNFADNLSRTLTVIFTDATLTVLKKGGLNWTGLEGLKHLEPGMSILIDGAENIRGKTEFKANIVNIL